MQEEFLAQHSRPAAKVTRIARKASVTATPTQGRSPGREASSQEAALEERQTAAGKAVKEAGTSSASASGAPVSAVAAAPGGKKGAATAKRVRWQQVDSDSTDETSPDEDSAEAPDAGAAPEPRSILAPMEGLLGDIIERSPAPPALQARLSGVAVVRDVVTPFPDAPTAAAPAAAAAPFPEATHRRQSKFALSRKAKQQVPLAQQQQQQQQLLLLSGLTAPQAPLPPREGRLPESGTFGVAADANRGRAGALTRSTPSDWSIHPTGPSTDGHGRYRGGDAEGTASVRHADTDVGGGNGDGAREMSAISSQNLQAVSQMQPEAVAAALEELSTRMSPEMLEFLRRRGAHRLQQQQPPGLSDRGGSDRGPAPPGQASESSDRATGQAAGTGAAAAPESRVPGRRDRPPWGPMTRGSVAAQPEMASCATQEHSNAIMDAALRAVTEGRVPGSGTAASEDGTGTAASGGGSTGRLPASVAAPESQLGSMPIGALTSAQRWNQEQRQQQREDQGSQGGRGAAADGGGPSGETCEAGVSGGATPAAAGEAARGSPADPRLVARLRFDVDGAVVDVQAPDETFLEEEVLLRDQLRRDEGSAPPGYTLGELLVLCRSAVAAQRVAGLLTIADLAATSRPRAEDIPLYAPSGGSSGSGGSGAGPGRDWTPGQMLRRFVEIPEPLRDRAPALSVAWQQVWQFFVSELGLVAHLRLALDDDRAVVVAAAAAALAAVLGRSESDLLAAEMADLCPNTGWPTPTGGYLSRPGIAAPWEAQPPAQPDPAAAGTAGSRPGADAEADPPEDVALVDPLAGALQMGLLQRARYLLASRHAPGAVLPLLAVLCAVARSGAAAALAIAKEPGLLAAVGGLLDPAAAVAAVERGTGDSKDQDPGQGQGQQGRPSSHARVAGAGQDPGAAVQVAALMLVRQLCCASSVAAQLVRSAGLLAHTQAYILLAAPADAAAHADGKAEPSAGGGPSNSASAALREPALSLQLLRLEALRAWRACAHHGISLASMDDLYGSLCHLLLPPPSQPSLPPPSSPASAAVRQVTTAELYLLLASLVRHSLAVASGDATIGRSMLAPGAAAVIASEALTWLRPDELRGVAAAAVARCNLIVPLLSGASGGGFGPCGGLLRALQGAHPALLLPPAAAHVARLAAVASFLATYWATVPAAQPVFGAVRQAVVGSGLLLVEAEPPGGRGSEGDAVGLVLSPTDSLAMQLLRREPSGDGGGGDDGDESHETVASERQSSGKPAGSASVSLTVDGGSEGAGRRASGANAGSPVGAALTAWAVAVMSGRLADAAESARGRQYAGHTRSGEGLRLGALAQSCLQDAASSLLYGTLQLTAAIHRDDSASSGAGPLAAAVVKVAAPRCCQAAAAAPAAVGRVLCPWHTAALQRHLHVSRLQLLAGTLLAPSFFAANTPATEAGTDPAPEAQQSQGHSQQHQQQLVQQQGAEQEQQGIVNQVQACLLEGCLAALSTAPPGAEGLCLQALRLGLRAPLLHGPLSSAYKAAAHLMTSGDPKLALAAAGVPYTVAVDADSVAGACTGEAAPFPLPPAAPEAADVAETLFESYAASWLSLISQRRLANGAGHATNKASAGAQSLGAGDSSSHAPAGSGVAPGSPPCPPVPQMDPLELTPVSLQGQAGSRLPAPSQWALLEAHRLPQRRPQATNGPEALDPVGCALLLSLGREVSCCEATGRGASTHLQGQVAGAMAAGAGAGAGGTLGWLTAGAKAQAALQAAYLFRAEEMMPQPGRHLTPQAGDEASEGSWREPLVRWALAGLLRRYLCTVGTAEGQVAQPLPPGPPGPDWLPPALAERLVSSLVSTCFGDPLLAAHLALALAPGAGAVVRLQVWNSLAQEKSLHLLPPLSRCLGDPAKYLRPVPAGTSNGSADLDPDPAFLAALQRSLIEGDLDRALQPQSPAQNEPHPDRQARPYSSVAATSTAGSSMTPRAADSHVFLPGGPCASVAGDIALYQLANSLLRRDRWPAVGRAWRQTSPAEALLGPQAAGSSQDGHKGGGAGASDAGASGPGVITPGVSPAAAMLSGLVRSAAPEVVARLVMFAEARCGLGRENAAAVLVQTCGGGDSELRERVRRALVLCGPLV